MSQYDKGLSSPYFKPHGALGIVSQSNLFGGADAGADANHGLINS